MLTNQPRRRPEQPPWSSPPWPGRPASATSKWQPHSVSAGKWPARSRRTPTPCTDRSHPDRTGEPSLARFPDGKAFRRSGGGGKCLQGDRKGRQKFGDFPFALGTHQLGCLGGHHVRVLDERLERVVLGECDNLHHLADARENLQMEETHDYQIG